MLAPSIGPCLTHPRACVRVSIACAFICATPDRLPAGNADHSPSAAPPKASNHNTRCSPRQKCMSLLKGIRVVVVADGILPMRSVCRPLSSLRGGSLAAALGRSRPVSTRGILAQTSGSTFVVASNQWRNYQPPFWRKPTAYKPTPRKKNPTSCRRLRQNRIPGV